MSQKTARRQRQLEPKVPYQHTVNPKIHFTTKLLVFAIFLMLVAIAVVALVNRPNDVRLAEGKAAGVTYDDYRSPGLVFMPVSGYTARYPGTTIHEYIQGHGLFPLGDTDIMVLFRKDGGAYAYLGKQIIKLDMSGRAQTVGKTRLRVAGVKYYHYHLEEGKPADDNDVRVGIEVLEP